MNYYPIWDADIIRSSIHFLRYYDNTIADSSLKNLLTALSYFNKTDFSDNYIKEIVKQLFDIVFLDKESFNFLEIYEEEDVRLDLTLETGADWSGYFVVAKLEETGEYLSNKTTDGQPESVQTIQTLWLRDIQSALTDKKLLKVIVQLEQGTTEANGEAVRVVDEVFIGLKQKPIDSL